jgi:hypothetical protein
MLTERGQVVADVEFTTRALERVTPEQIEAIKRLTYGNHKVELGVTFDLPEGYLFFVQSHLNGRQIYGGISPEGDVST